MDVPLHVVDAFTDRLFAGNPAAVVPLARPVPDALLQSVAAETNLSETAFLTARGAAHAPGTVPEYDLRWFTPSVEVDLCGHATLASAGWLFDDVHPDADALAFHTRSGVLHARRGGPSAVTLDFPTEPLVPAQAPAAALQALDVVPAATFTATDLVLVVDDSATVRRLDPDHGLLRRLPVRGVVVTAPGGPGDDADVVSRWFGAGAGIGEDPVTGSAHSQMAPYWAERLGRTTLRARQLSARGGLLTCEVAGDRVLLTGGYRRWLDGTAHLPDA